MDTLESLTVFVTTHFECGASSSLHPDDDLLKQGILDSMSIMRIIDYIAQDLGVELEGDDVTVENFRSLASMTRLVQRKLEAPGD